MVIGDILTKIFTLTTLGFLTALLATPILTYFLYRYKLGKNIRGDGSTPIFTALHESKKGTPTMGGILIWGTTLFLALVFWVGDRIFGFESFHALNFLTRRETLLPLGAFVGAALVGLFDDLLDIYRMGHMGRGIAFRYKVLIYALVASIGAWWFYFKLDFSVLNVPFFPDVNLGIWFIPFFILVVVGTSFAVNQTDGLDGLAGGSLIIAFFAYSIIAYSHGNSNLAAFLGVICGALLAFLWFNVYPARFFMGDTGSMGMGVVLAIVAFLTGGVLILPIIGLVFVLEAFSTALQIGSKYLFGKKIFLSAPLHHHLEATGWPETKVTMRAWILSAVAGIIGVIVYFLSL
jgi:phospho-N-acetylmuramoyl-pentapeptide-transferase